MSTLHVYTADEAAVIATFKSGQSPSDAQLQWYIDKGVWGQEGAIGRAMMAGIEDGRLILGPEPAHDFWGNRIPAEYEVEDGTKGSIQYAQRMREEWAENDPWHGG